MSMTFIWKDGDMVPGRHIPVQCDDYLVPVGSKIDLTFLNGVPA